MARRPIVFTQAKHYTAADRRAVNRIVIHSAEVGETLDGAEALARVCANNPRKASWHYAIDADTITQSVRETDVAWAAPGANRDGIQIELCGRARQSAHEWSDDYSRAQRELLAELVALIAWRWEIPLLLVGPEGLKAGERGITTHDAVSRAFKLSDHWDPGPHFPAFELIAHAQDLQETEGVLQLQRGDRGALVARWQSYVKAKPDGDFGRLTELATMSWQRGAGLEPTGVVVPAMLALAGRAAGS